jgi:glutamyl-tRNA synthetase
MFFNHGDQEIFSKEEMIHLFDIKAINKSAAAFNVEKLQWLNQHYLKTLAPDYIAEQLQWHMQQQGLDISKGPALAELVVAQRERAKTLKEMAEKSRFFYEEIDPAVFTQQPIPDDIKPALTQLLDHLTGLSEWTDAAIHQAINETAEAFGLKLGKLAQPLRIVITGGTVSPPIDCTVRLLGKKRTLERIKNCL